jgi:hypothetical protein
MRKAKKSFNTIVAAPGIRKSETEVINKKIKEDVPEIA